SRDWSSDVCSSDLRRGSTTPTRSVGRAPASSTPMRPISTRTSARRSRPPRRVPTRRSLEPMSPAPRYPIPVGPPTPSAPGNGHDGSASIRLCVIDMGTNSFHAIVFDAFPDGTFEVVGRLKEVVALGEGGFTSHRLTDEAQGRGLAALHQIRAMADGHGVADYVACATSAVREAENGGEFIERVRDEVGLY